MAQQVKALSMQVSWPEFAPQDPCNNIKKKLEVVAHVCNINIPSVRWEVDSGELVGQLAQKLAETGNSASTRWKGRANCKSVCCSALQTCTIPHVCLHTHTHS